MLTLLIGFCAFALVHTATSLPAATSIHCSFETSNSYGAQKDTFAPSEDVYITGSGFQPGTLDIYVVPHRETWKDGDTIPSRITGTATKVTTDASGNIPPTPVWAHDLIPGKYDILIDVNSNGRYDKNADCLVSNDVNINAGFFVVPEYVLGAILGLAAFFAAYGVFRLSKPHGAKNLTKKN
jgi:hypothetical protein